MYSTPSHPLNAGLWCHDAQHIDNQNDKTQNIYKICYTQHYGTQHKDTTGLYSLHFITLKLMNGAINLKCYITHG